MKVFNAWRMPTMSTNSFQVWLNDLRNNLKKIADEIFLKETIRRAVYDYDMATIFPDTYKKQTLTSFWCEVMHEYQEVKKTNKRNPLVDAECELVFYFKGRYIYFVMFSEQDIYADFISNLPNVNEYSYWDNTDKPATISYREWNKRRKIWNEVFGYCQAKLGGLTFCLVGDYHIPLPSEDRNVIQYVPSLKARVTGLVATISYQEYIKTYNLAHGADSCDLNDVITWISSPEGKLARENLKPVIQEKIQENITFSDLNN